MICELCSCSFDGRKSRFVIRRESKFGPPSLTHFCSKKCLERSQTGWIPLRCRNCAHRFPGKVRRRNAKRHRKPFCSPGCRAVFPLRMKTRLIQLCYTAESVTLTGNGWQQKLGGEISTSAKYAVLGRQHAGS